MNENIICYQGLSFQIWVDNKKILNERKIKIQTICRVPGGWHSAKDALPSAEHRHSAKFTLCRVPPFQHSAKDNGRQAPWRPAHDGHACWARDLSLPSARLPALDKGSVCRVPFFADGQHSAKCGHVVCHMFAECPRSGTQQRSSLPSARDLALGNPVDTRHLCVFR